MGFATTEVTCQPKQCGQASEGDEQGHRERARGEEVGDKAARDATESQVEEAAPCHRSGEKPTPGK